MVFEHLSDVTLAEVPLIGGRVLGGQAFELTQSFQILPMKTDSQMRTLLLCFPYLTTLKTFPVPPLELVQLNCPDRSCAKRRASREEGCCIPSKDLGEPFVPRSEALLQN